MLHLKASKKLFLRKIEAAVIPAGKDMYESPFNHTSNFAKVGCALRRVFPWALGKSANTQIYIDKYSDRMVALRSLMVIVVRRMV